MKGLLIYRSVQDPRLSYGTTADFEHTRDYLDFNRDLHPNSVVYKADVTRTEFVRGR